jgi:hypothetical protein
MVSWSPDPLRPVVMLCGTSSRDAATFVPPGSNLALVSGCVADSDTQATLVARDGNPAAEDLQAFLMAGGRVITEFSNGATIFNAVFGTNVAGGNFQGG